MSWKMLLSVAALAVAACNSPASAEKPVTLAVPSGAATAVYTQCGVGAPGETQDNCSATSSLLNNAG